MITKINHCSFTVSNLDSSIEFYRDILGLEVVDISYRKPDFAEKVTGIADAYLKIAYFKVDDAYVELIEYLSPKGGIRLDTHTLNVGSAHICFNVDAFDEFVENLVEHKVNFSGEVCKVAGGPNVGRKVLYFEDPDCNTLEIFSNERY